MTVQYKICLISLGCPKNLVDSEVIAGHLSDASLRIVAEPDEADGAIINTCGFLESAREESIATIQQICRLKDEGRLAAVIVVGCLVQRFGPELKKALPRADAFLPITDYSGVPALLKRLLSGKKAPLGRGGRARSSRTDLKRMLLTEPHVSYLRVAEGCTHQCSFCAIPMIRGRLVSKPVSVLVEEAEALAATGVKEINLVAEDTTEYGRDLGGKLLLPDLLGALGRVEGIQWIRVLYGYPTGVSKALARAIAENAPVVNYLDMPVQHISARILRSMRRNTPPARIRAVLEMLRENVPGIVLRTSVIVGYPGETDGEFEELMEFLAAFRFERLGAFVFSPEEGTRAYAMKNRIPPEVARRRLDRVMRLQHAIIEERNKSLVGADVEVIVDRITGNGSALGRTRADAPEIDCAVELRSEKENLKQGMILEARITGFDEYDLQGVPLFDF